MENKYNICTFSLTAIPKMPPVSPPMMINVKQCMVREIFFCISVVATENKFGNHCSKACGNG
jgi:hypothetical protein